MLSIKISDILESPDLVLDETNSLIRASWVIEQSMSKILVNQNGKLTHKKVRLINDFIGDMIKYLSIVFDDYSEDFKELIYTQLSFSKVMTLVTRISSEIMHIKAIPNPVLNNKQKNKTQSQMLRERYIYLENAVADFDYNEQQVFTELHMSIAEFEKQNYYRMNEVLSAKSKEDRPMTGAGFMQNFGQGENGVGNLLQKKGGSS